MYFSSVTALKTNSITVRGRKYKSTVSMLANARKDHSLTMGCSIQLAWRCSLEVTSVTPSHSPVGHRGKIVFSFVSTRIRTTMPAKKIKLGKMASQSPVLAWLFSILDFFQHRTRRSTR